jgi:hypothetical protein
MGLVQSFPTTPEVQVSEDGFMATLPIPNGVEHLLDSVDIETRIAYIRKTLPAPYEPTPELRRLVAHQANRELRRLGVIA